MKSLASVSAFLLGSLSSLVSVALGYWAGFLRQLREDKKRRRGIATALLAEFRPLERMLRTRAKHTKAAESTVQINMPVFDRFQSDLVLFDANTTQVLLELRAFIRDIENSADLFARDGTAINERAHHYMRLKAIGAANLIPIAKDLLEGAGGKSPVDPKVALYTVGKLPPLDDPAFPNAVNLETHQRDLS
jgi:hypothetical protein